MPLIYYGSPEEEIKEKSKNKPFNLVEEIEKNKIKRREWFSQFERKYHGKIVKEISRLS